MTPEAFVEEPTTPLDPRLGRIAELDIRSAEFPIRALLDPTMVLHTQLWPCPEYLDQGNVGACVGFSMAHDIISEPMALASNFSQAMNIYKEAQKIDPWPGEAYEGTSVLAGVKILQQMSYVSEYRWAFSIDDVLQTLSNLGPIVFGLNWYQGMFSPDAEGLIRPTGGLAGGHAILAVGYDHERQLVRFHNSWGVWWGKVGDCFITVADLTRLLAERGEACVPVVRTNPNPPPPEPIPPEPTPPEPTPPEPVPPEPTPPSNTGYFNVKGSMIFHDIHKVKGVVEWRWTEYRTPIAMGFRPCKTCRPR